MTTGKSDASKAGKLMAQLEDSQEREKRRGKRPRPGEGEQGEG
jgi:hypothetical protein